MFCCVFNVDGEVVAPQLRAHYAARIRSLAEGDRVEEVDAGTFVAWVVPARVPLRPLWAWRRGRLAVGNVRLDHPEEVRRWGGTAETGASPLDLVLDAVEARGGRCLNELLGDFVIVIHDPCSRTVLAARDAFGVKTLFRREQAHILVLGSHLELIHETETIDDEFVADFLVGGDPGPERTIWMDARAVAPGSLLTADSMGVRTTRFWSAADFDSLSDGDSHEAVLRFRELLAIGVQTRLEAPGQVWAELSGGLDSSSVVSMAQSMYEDGRVESSLAGTVSLVDHLGAGDERQFSDLVVNRYGLPNKIVLNPWPWQDSGSQPPLTDEPRAHYPYFARDKMLCDAIRAERGKALLTGWGPDHYLYGTLVYISDLLARRHLLSAVSESCAWAIALRQSAWGTFAQEALVPLLPRSLQYPFTPEWDAIPTWIASKFAKRVALKERLDLSKVTQASRGSRFVQQTINYIDELTRWLPRGEFERGLEMRHPFLYRPLVELGLSLGVSMRVRPPTNKWILREAMKHVLPELIRIRPGKGGVDARILWALSKERRRIDEILTSSILEQHSYVDGRRLREAVDAARTGRQRHVLMLLCVLGLETWLFVREGRWIIRQATN